MKKNLSILGLVFSIIFLASFYQTKEFTDPFIMPKHFFLAFSGLVGIIFILFYYVTRKYILKYNINLIDISIYAYVGYITFHSIINGEDLIKNVRYLSLLILPVIYFLYRPVFCKEHPRNRQNKFQNTIVLVIIIIGILQSFFGLGQYFGIFEMLQSEFKIAGAFGNPGPYANFLVAILPFSLGYAISLPKSRLKYIAIISSLLIYAVLPFTAARTSWIAAILVTVYVLAHLQSIIKVKNKYLSSWRNKLIFVSGVVAILVVGFYALTSFKQESASGRLFIWKVSLEMIKDKPVLGHGFSNFSTVHNDYQANYFRDNPNDWDNAYLVDGVNYAFNEYIQIAAELGIVGLLAFLFIPFS